MIRRRRLHVLDEGGDRAVPRAADANAFFDPRELVRAGIGSGLGIRDVDRVVGGDVNATRPAELAPLIEVGTVLIENLNPIVLAVTDEQTTARVHRDRVRLADLAAPRALSSPLFEVGAVLRELDDAIVRSPAMAVGDEDRAVRRDDDVGRLIEAIGA